MERDIKNVVTLLELSIRDLQHTGLLGSLPLQNPFPSPAINAYLKITSCIALLTTLAYRAQTMNELEILFTPDGR
jgi:hypothetical protein